MTLNVELHAKKNIIFYVQVNVHYCSNVRVSRFFILNIKNDERFLNQGCICLSKNTIRTVIFLNCITI